MSSNKKLLGLMATNPRNVWFSDLFKVCIYYFGTPRIRGSHCFFTVPWEGEPLVNIQNDAGKAKAYQVRQVLKAISKLEGFEKDV